MSLPAGRSIPEISSVGEAIGKELSSIGINWHSVPVISKASILKEPLDALERFSDDVQAVSHYAGALLDGFSTGGAANCPKVDLTATVLEVYRVDNGHDLDLEEISRREDVLPLKFSVGMGGLDSLLLTASFDQSENVARAGASYKKVIQQLLRQYLRFQGLVIFDCSQISSGTDGCVKHAPLRALISGSDMIILPPGHHDQLACIRAIHAAVGSPGLPSVATTRAIERIKAFKAHNIGGWDALPPPTDQAALREQHARLAQSAYRHATTVLSTGPSPIENLSAPSILLLLAPSIPRLPTMTSTPTLDPFERLGRAIASFQPRTRHVPYTLSAGLTSTHTAFLDRAAAVVLVLCNPSSAFEESQEEFIHAVQTHLRDRESRSAEREIGRIVLAAGDPRDLNQPLEGWWEVCCYEYTVGALEAAAEVITGQRTATGRIPVKLSRHRNRGQQM